MKKSERLNQELIFLNGKSAFQLSDLMEEFHISKRTALRDVQELERIGLPFYVDNGRYGGYRLIRHKPLVPIYFSNEEIEAVFFALKALTLLSSTPFEKSYHHIRQKLLAIIPSSQQTRITQLLAVIDYHSVPPVNEIQQLGLMLQSILDEKIVTLTDEQHGTERIRLQIAELFYRSGIWFCSAYNVETNKWGTYRCDCLSEITVNEDSTNAYSRNELQAFQTAYENTYHNIPFRCRLTNLGKELFLKKNYPNMSLEIIDEVPYIVGGYNQEELAYMTQYVISLGRNIVVEYPTQLRDCVLADLQMMIAEYE